MWTTAGEFYEQFFELIDANRWSFHGDLMELVDGRPAQPDKIRDTAAGKENNCPEKTAGALKRALPPSFLSRKS